MNQLQEFKINKLVLDKLGIKYEEDIQYCTVRSHIKHTGRTIINIDQEMNFVYNFSLLELIIKASWKYELEFLQGVWTCSINDCLWQKAETINLATINAFLASNLDEVQVA